MATTSLLPESLRKEILYTEQAWFAGIILATMIYTAELMFYAATCIVLLRSRNPFNQRRNTFFILSISLIFTLSTIYLLLMLVFAEKAFFESRLIPVLSTTATLVMIVKGWLCEMINAWRSIVIYQGCRVPSWVVNLVPCLLSLLVVAVGVVSLVEQLPLTTGTAGSTGAVTPKLLPYMFLVISLAVNILITILVVSRLLFYRSRINRILGRAQGTQYTSLAAIVVESAFVYSSVAILVIVLVTLPNAGRCGETFILILSPVQGISTILIIFRVAKGKAWSSEIYENTFQLSDPAFTAQTDAVQRTLGNRDSFCPTSEHQESG
ncbi:hypothetical protein NP233_g1380 [Leucocoprinus birnbaumii]|uniref:Uncharacterized protein n=1 Tax=Leucocoprinus birnbaumii TaxID=56174 RepID=A0AAD5W140_9AGAR|nr:hypothetical protein NP233_g1380 [Leucocoprinus birnbaumii]